MATKQASLDDSDEDPWKDKRKLQSLYHADDLNQSEMAEYFTEKGYEVAPSTISYWMGKLEVETTHNDHGSNGDRGNDVDCAHCGTEVPGNGMICTECLDEARQKQRREEKEMFGE